MTLPPLLQLSYWFDSLPPPFLPVIDRSLLAVFGILLVAGIIARIVASRHGWEKMTKRLVARSGGMLTTLGAFGLVLYALSYERVPVLSSRLGYLLWVGLLGWYVWKTYRFIRVEIPSVQKRREEREQLEKWLPKPNNK
ncbi:hypothetical protein KJ781_00475 [Patescibacteria group bacterium]|nr:hypothetical protein [Patescibacteria group bacterium]MBU1448441.1 hypothetical protein [Patescibacteria group bacterium]MBU2612877.1 hypothetical protein [Patescibacteria group bacterium]